MSAPVPAEPADLDARLDAVRELIASLESVAVAFSGGVDSTLVLALAAEVLGERAVAVTGISPSVAPAEAARAEELAHELGVRLVCAATSEFDNPDYVANPPDRCFHCKTELYAVCRRAADALGMTHLLSGANADDLGDWRPGLVAAREAGVRAPLLECGLTKAHVRAAARRMGLSNWDKPALACLASRLPYGTTVTPDRLAAVDRVEAHLRSLGFRQVRARHHGVEVRLEVETARVEELMRLQSDPHLLDAIRAAGFERLAVEPGGYRQGRLNDALESRT